MKKNINILDCTFRDGGYYNSWAFSDELLQKYLDAIAHSGIKIVELGMRNFPKQGFYGPYAYTTDTFLENLSLPKGITYGVMIDGSTLLRNKEGITHAVNKLFGPASKSKIGLVRIASHYHEIEHLGPAALELNLLGYQVGLNLMQSGGKKSEIIRSAVKEVRSWQSINVLYFADSLGNMDAQEVERICHIITEEWDQEIGIHTHNNMERAVDNCMAAVQCGVTWIDSTITGMGRGAGNAQTERILAYFSDSVENLNPQPVYELAIEEFEPMQKLYGWGSNLLYFLSAKNDVHPSYIQSILSRKHLKNKEIVQALKYLIDKKDTAKFDGKILENALSLTECKDDYSGQEVTNIFKNKDVLLVANTSSLKSYLKDINLFIEKVEPIVVSLNVCDLLDEENIDYICLSHNFKFVFDKSNYSKQCSSFIYPKNRFSNEELMLIPERVESIDYSLNVHEGEFEHRNTGCAVPCDLTFAYAIAFCFQANARRIYLAGFEGYEATDARQIEMLSLLSLIRKNESNYKNIISLTPTSYPVELSSLYAFL